MQFVKKFFSLFLLFAAGIAQAENKLVFKGDFEGPTSDHCYFHQELCGYRFSEDSRHLLTNKGDSRATITDLKTLNQEYASSSKNFIYGFDGKSRFYVQLEETKDYGNDRIVLRDLASHKEVLVIAEVPYKAPGSLHRRLTTFAAQGDFLAIGGPEFLWLVNLTTMTISSLGNASPESTFAWAKFSADTKYLAVEKPEGIFLMDTMSPKKPIHIRIVGYALESFGFNKDATSLLTFHRDHFDMISQNWNLATETVNFSIPFGDIEGYISAEHMIILPESSEFLVYQDYGYRHLQKGSGLLNFYDSNNGKLKSTLTVDIATGIEKKLNTSEDGRYLILGSNKNVDEMKGVISLVDLKTKTIAGTFPMPGEWIRDYVISPDTKKLAVSTNRYTVVLSIPTMEVLGTTANQSGLITHMRWSPDSRFVAFELDGKKIRLYSIEE